MHSLYIPNQTTVLRQCAVWNAADLFRFQSAVLPPAYDMPPGGGTDVNGKIELHSFHPVIIFQMPRKKCPLAISSIPGSTPPFMPPEIIMLRIGAPAEAAICIRKFGFS